MDGIFVARWVNTDALSAINITMPMIYVASALGMMFGSGGNFLHRIHDHLGKGCKYKHLALGYVAAPFAHLDKKREQLSYHEG